VTLTLPNAPACAPNAATKLGELVFVGGSVAAAGTAAPTPPGDVRAQARAAFDALAELLEMAGGGIGDVVELVSLHTDARTIETVFDVGRERFDGDPPAWTPVAVTAHRTPGTLVTLTAVAHLGDAPRRCVVPDTIKWWREHPASAGCRKGDLLVVAGQYGSDADGNVNTPGDHAGQARNALNRVAEICALSDASLDDVVAVTSFHQDPRWIPSVAAVYEDEFFGATGSPGAPAWGAVGVPGLLRAGMVGQYRAVADVGAKSGLVAATGVPPIAGGDIVHRGDPEAQARAAFDALAERLGQAGASLADVAQLVSFHLDAEALEAAARIAREVLDGDHPPPWTAAGMTGTWQEGQQHALHALAVR
jgi:enamine deaminase RidA (YjgF/YER057c/UK114 family)